MQWVAPKVKLPSKDQLQATCYRLLATAQTPTPTLPEEEGVFSFPRPFSAYIPTPGLVLDPSFRWGDK